MGEECGGRCVKGSVWMRCGRSVGKVCEGKCVDEVWEKCGGKMCERKCVDEVWQESGGKVWEGMTGECE